MGPSLCVQDHAVLLLSPQDFENPPPWIKDNFNILEGGVHAGRVSPSLSPPTHLLTWSTGQSSRNKLIIFADGTYLELFCWIDTPREFHAWADKPPGLIDFALTSVPPLTAESLHNDIQSKLRDNESGQELDLSYTSPEAGGRSKPDGVQIKWKTSRPISSKSVNRTDFPFFCHDVTPRRMRVPFEDSEITRHPCGAVGISIVEILVPKSELSKYAELYGLILGTTTKISGELSDEKRSNFELARPNKEYGVSNIVLRPAEDQSNWDWLQNRGTCIRAIFLSVKDRQGHGEEALGTEGTVSTIFLKW